MNSNVEIIGDLKASQGAIASDGATVKITGSICADVYAVGAARYAHIEVFGDVISEYGGVYIFEESGAVINGNVYGGIYGIIAVRDSEKGAAVTVTGNVTAGEVGVWANFGSQVTIDGELICDDIYILFGYRFNPPTLIKSKADREPISSKPGYREYTDGESCVWVRDATPDNCCIDYSRPDIIVPGSVAGFSINLTKETLTIPGGFSVTHFRTDENKWKPVKQALTAERFPRLLNKDMKLEIKDANDVVVTFPKINKRAPQQKFAINYRIGRDQTGATPGEWVLVRREDAKNANVQAVKAGIQIGLAAMVNGKPGKTTDAKGFGYFYDHCGICVKPLPDAVGAKPVRTTYFIRMEPAQNGEVYTAASRARRIRASGELRAPKASVRERAAKGNSPATATLRVRANTYTIIPNRANGEAELHAAKNDIDVLGIAGNIEVWTAASARRPASAKTPIIRT
jgi:hypothetical protein